MKKTLALLLTGILALSLALAGCSSSTSKEKDDGKGDLVKRRAAY